MAFRCVHCGTEAMPYIKKRVSAGGWVMFIVLLLFCIPLCWLPFVIDAFKEEERFCRGCGLKLG
ncbi:MAG TPA: LITAF-like zinc ribbon domain-containing protein [Pseudobacteroides sp.]|nr:LITAF-like zinc ribbon domain-containing protein [Pseudobacteroides sp.]